jgi:hypothetical protein
MNGPPPALQAEAADAKTDTYPVLSPSAARFKAEEEAFQSSLNARAVHELKDKYTVDKERAAAHGALFAVKNFSIGFGSKEDACRRPHSTTQDYLEEYAGVENLAGIRAAEEESEGNEEREQEEPKRQEEDLNFQTEADLELHRVSTAEEVSRCAILPHWLLFPHPSFRRSLCLPFTCCSAHAQNSLVQNMSSLLQQKSGHSIEIIAGCFRRKRIGYFRRNRIG